jgi:Secretion system C-terminal sorting domain
LAEIKGKGNQNTLNRYQFTDTGPLSIAYYRLKQVDENGDFNYSKIISLKQLETDRIDVFPNPVLDVLTIKTKDIEGDFVLKIYDVSGRIWLSKSFKSNDRALNVSDLPNGEYFVEIKHKEGVWIKKLVKISRE